MAYKLIQRVTRRLMRKVEGPPKQPEVPSPLLQTLDLAIRNIHFQTRLARNEFSPGQVGSLLGDYLEFGCFKGESFRHVLSGAAKDMPWMRFFALDSFEGLPRLGRIDEQGSFLQGQYACSQEEFLRNVYLEDVEPQRIICVPGWYDQSLTQDVKVRHSLRIAAIVTIDCDLYESAVPVLNFLTDVVETGTILLFDDWFCFKGDPERGVQRACSEWLLSSPHLRLQEWHLFGGFGKSFIVIKKGAHPE
jgi:hypothetical protein